MIEITFLQMTVFITAAWIIVRLLVALKAKTVSVKHELLLLLVYICLVVIARFVYFELHPVFGYPPPLRIVLNKNYSDFIHLKPFNFISDIYEEYSLNVFGNIAMFFPVGIVWPICFKKLNRFWKTALACIGFSLFIELTQLFCDGRHTDIDDLILNSIGAIAGVAIVFIIRTVINRHNKET